MGFGKWLKRRGVVGAIPKNAVEQYHKWHRKDPNLDEGEIAEGIFTLRYKAPIPPLNREERRRFLGYEKGGFKFECLVDFCLASLDVEADMAPEGGDKFKETCEVILEELGKLGFQADAEQVDSFILKYLDDVLDQQYLTS